MGFEQHANALARTVTRGLGTGMAVLFTPAGGDPLEVHAVFDAAHVDVEPETGRPVLSTQPVLGVSLAELGTEPAQGDTFSVGGVVYTVARFEPDGVAGGDVFLHQVAT